MIDANVSTPKQTNSLLFACISRCIRAFRFGMIFVLAKDIPIRLHARCPPSSIMASGRNSVAVSCVLVNPVHFEPASRIAVIRRDEMEMLRVRAFGMAESLHVAGQQEIEGFDLVCVNLAFIQFGQRPDHGGTAHGHSTHSRPVFEFQDSVWASLALSAPY